MAAATVLYMSAAIGCGLSHTLAEMIVFRAAMGYAGGTFLVRGQTAINLAYAGVSRFKALFVFAIGVTLQHHSSSASRIHASLADSLISPSWLPQDARADRGDPSRIAWYNSSHVVPRAPPAPSPGIAMNDRQKNEDLNARLARLERLVEEQGRKLEALDKAAAAVRQRAERARVAAMAYSTDPAKSAARDKDLSDRVHKLQSDLDDEVQRGGIAREHAQQLREEVEQQREGQPSSSPATPSD